MIKFSEVKRRQLFTFPYYDRRDCPIQNGFIWVFLKLNETDFIAVHCDDLREIGKTCAYKKDDDSPCILLSSSFEIIE
jgi:hypothetical protein